MGVDGDGVRQVSPSEFDEGYVSWTADSRALVYDSFRGWPSRDLSRLDRNRRGYAPDASRSPHRGTPV